jgi:phage tail-like protein
LNKDLYEWRMNIVNGQADARSMAVSHLSTAAEAVRTWWIEGAWPVRWSAPSFDSMAARPAMEEIEICVSRFEWR